MSKNNEALATVIVERDGLLEQSMTLHSRLDDLNHFIGMNYESRWRDAVLSGNLVEATDLYQLEFAARTGQHIIHHEAQARVVAWLNKQG